MIRTLSWPEIDLAVERLVGAVRAEGAAAPCGLVAIARGGLIPATLLAHRLGLRRIELIGVESYTGRTAGPLHVTTPLSLPEAGSGFLIIDDLVDQGHTARFVRRLFPQARFGCLYAKPLGRDAADWVGIEVGQEVWLEFPWERA